MSELFCHTVTQQCSNHTLSPPPYTGFIKFSTFLTEKVTERNGCTIATWCAGEDTQPGPGDRDPDPASAHPVQHDLEYITLPGTQSDYCKY